jgi:hypothetical protein
MTSKKRRFTRDLLDDGMHRAIYERCEYLLADRGYFSKDEAMTTAIGEIVDGHREAEEWELYGFANADFSYNEDSINWDGIRKLLESKAGANTELMALAARFFKSHKAEDLQNMPEKFLAMGYGKRTAGFGMFGCGGGHLALRVLKQRRRVAKGVASRVTDGYKAAEKVAGMDPEALPNGTSWDVPTPDSGSLKGATKKLERKLDSQDSAYDTYRDKIAMDEEMPKLAN